MIGKATLKKYEFETIYDYFRYIFDSKINGNSKQMRELINKLNREQKVLFCNWLKEFDCSNIIKHEDFF